MYLIGMMSGTSLDAVDAVLIYSKNQKIIASTSYPLPATLKTELSALNTSSHNDLHRSKVAEYQLTHLYAKAANQLIDRSHINHHHILAIGAHGQTIRHQPNSQTPYTIQLLNGALLSQLTKCNVVCDFRSKDIAFGGQGAPLAPLFHRILIPDETNFAIVNIGGISNISLIDQHQSIGYDVGPGNCLLDEWVNLHLKKPYDKNGDWGKTGTVNTTLFQKLCSDPFIQQKPPKSTGRDYYNLDWLKPFLTEPVPANDVMRTLTKFTAYCICKDLNPKIQTLYIAGGGAKNRLLCQDIALLTSATIRPTPVDPQLIESLGFAWLAKQTMHRHRQNTPPITGSRQPLILGCIHYY